MESVPFLILLCAAAFTWPLLRGRLHAREMLVIVVPIMAFYGSVSVGFGRSATAEIQWWLLLLALASTVSGRLFVRGALAQAPSFEVRPKIRFLASFTCIGLVIAAYLLATNGIPLLSSNVAVERVEILSNGYLATVMVATLQAAIVVAAVSLDSRLKPRENGVYVLIVLGLVGVILLFGNRGTAVFPLLGVAIYYLLKNYTRIVPIAVFATALLGAVSIAGYIRNYTAWGATYDNDLARMGFEGPIKYFAPIIDYMTGTSTAMDIILNTIPDKVPYPMGNVFFSPLLAPLPGEQPSPGVFLKQTAGFDFEGFGLAMGGIGGFYMDFGALGVLLGFLLIGALVGYARKKSQLDSRWTVVLSWLGGHIVLMNYAHPLPNFATIILPVLLFWGLTKPDPSSTSASLSAAGSASIPLQKR